MVLMSFEYSMQWIYLSTQRLHRVLMDPYETGTALELKLKKL